MKVSWACQSLLRNFFSRTHQRSSVNRQKLCLLLEMDFNIKDLKTALLLSTECWQRRSCHPALLLLQLLAVASWAATKSMLNPLWISKECLVISDTWCWCAPAPLPASCDPHPLFHTSEFGKHLSICCKDHPPIFPVTLFHFAVHCSQQDRTTFPCSVLPQLFDQCLWCEWAFLPSFTVSSLQGNTPSQCLWAEQPVFQWSNSFFVSRAQQLWAILTYQHFKQG